MRFRTLLYLMFCLLMATSATLANDENLPDTLMIEQVEVEKGAKVALNISFVNDQELAALTIPLGLVGDAYAIDSVSFVGSRVEYLKMRPVTIAENRKEVVFGAICMTEDYIPAGKGLMATLYLSPLEAPKAKGCEVDTITMGPASVLFTKQNSSSFIPRFKSGKIKFKSAEKAEDKEKPEGDSKDKKSN